MKSQKMKKNCEKCQKPIPFGKLCKECYEKKCELNQENVRKISENIIQELRKKVEISQKSDDDIDSDEYKRKYLIHYVSRYGELEKLIDLIEKGDNINKMDCFGKSPMYYAAKYGQVDIVKKLIDLNVILGKGRILDVVEVASKMGGQKCLDCIELIIWKDSMIFKDPNIIGLNLITNFRNDDNLIDKKEIEDAFNPEVVITVGGETKVIPKSDSTSGFVYSKVNAEFYVLLSKENRCVALKAGSRQLQTRENGDYFIKITYVEHKRQHYIVVLKKGMEYSDCWYKEGKYDQLKKYDSFDVNKLVVKNSQDIKDTLKLDRYYCCWSETGGWRKDEKNPVITVSRKIEKETFGAEEGDFFHRLHLQDVLEKNQLSIHQENNCRTYYSNLFYIPMNGKISLSNHIIEIKSVRDLEHVGEILNKRAEKAIEKYQIAMKDQDVEEIGKIGSFEFKFFKLDEVTKTFSDFEQKENTKIIFKRSWNIKNKFRESVNDQELRRLEIELYHKLSFLNEKIRDKDLKFWN